MDLVILQPFLHAKGGLARVILEIARRYNPVIYTYRYIPEATYPEFREFDVRVVRPGLSSVLTPLPERVRWAIQSGEVFWNLKIRDDYDVVNAHGTPSEWGRNRNERMLWYCHTPNREAFDLYEWRMARRSLPMKAVFWMNIQVFKALEFRVVPKIEKIITNSKNSQARIKKYLRRESEVVYPGVDYKHFYNQGYEPFIFYPSRITPEKRFEIAIEAFRRFRDSSPAYSKFRMVIAGSLIPGNRAHFRYYESLKEMIKGYGRIILNPDWKTMRDLYSRAYVVVFTAINEDFGIVPLEAMASEKPVISLNEGGPRETIIDGETGFLVDGVDDMVERLKLLAERPDMVEAMGKKGRLHVRTNFNWERFMDGFDRAIREVSH